MIPPAGERPKLTAVLAQLSGTIEELFLSGLTTASDATRQALVAATQEAARFRLLRLASTLRTANELLGRFTTENESFSKERLVLFLSRTWMLSRGLDEAVKSGNEAAYDRLAGSPATQPLPEIEVICLGVGKKVAPGAFVAFEFRLRVLKNSGPLVVGQRLLWSSVFPLKPGVDVPAEGYLHLPQRQKFAAILFLERKSIRIENANWIADDAGGRITLGDTSKVQAGDTFTEWPQFLTWSPERAIKRIRKQNPDPLDVETELQEEVVLSEYQVGTAEPGDAPGHLAYPISTPHWKFHAVVGASPEGDALRKSLETLRTQEDRPPLFGVMHYERCRLVLQPLTLFRPEPEYLPISKENVNKAVLLKAMKFT